MLDNCGGIKDNNGNGGAVKIIMAMKVEMDVMIEEMIVVIVKIKVIGE